jgi:hypothetical protein
MPIDTNYFMQNPEQARAFAEGPNGVVLQAVATATALTNRRLIAGHFIFGGPELQQSGFLVHPTYQNMLERDAETCLFASLSAFLAEYQLLGQTNYETHRSAIAVAAREFGINYYIDTPSDLARRVVAIIGGNNDQEKLNKFLEIVRANYCVVQQALASGQYGMGEHTVVPSAILRTFCRAGLLERSIAMLKTRTEKSKRDALNRFTEERQNMAAE